METASFYACWKNPNGVSIASRAPTGWSGRTFSALAPSRDMLKLSEDDYLVRYMIEVLGQLNAEEVYHQLGKGAVLLCWENFPHRCHRRLVAEWLENAVGVVIPELGHDRKESIPFVEMKRANEVEVQHYARKIVLHKRRSLTSIRPARG